MEFTDEQLVLRFLEGDDGSLDILIGRYLKPIYNFLYRFTKDTDSLDDLTQETFIKVWKNIKRFDPDKKFKVWIYQIAKNTAYDFLKKKKTTPFSFFETEEGNKLETVSEENPLPDEILERQDLEKELDAKLKQLSDQHRVILFMRYKDDFSLQEISEILKVPYNTVKSQHQRAIGALRRLFYAFV